MTHSGEVHALHAGVVGFYDGLFRSPIHEEVYEGSGFSNWGYWTPDTKSAVRASEQLVDKLLEPVSSRGAVLDVACGSGGTTAYLTRSFDRVTAVNLSAYQIARTHARAPAARPVQMDATRLAFAPASFDVVICVEAVFHFPSKARFFADAYRVLKPGGWLVCSDVILSAQLESYRLREVARLPQTIFPYGNRWNLLAYQDVLEALGFTVTLTSAYQETWQSFLAFQRGWCERQIHADPGRAEVYRQGLATYASYNAAICDYLLVAARKE
jgi:SAM-dependent methyltransferase